MADVWLFPYLSLDRCQWVGRWRLIPRHRLRGRDVTARWVLPMARGLIGLYEPPRADPLITRRLGCFVVGRARRLGEGHESADMLSLHRAVTAGVLDRNSTTDADGMEGHAASTSDNAALHGHHVTSEGHVSAEYGAMVRTLVGGYTIGEGEAKILPPEELHLPLFGSAFDSEYATAVYRLLESGDGLAVRLGRAVDWLDLAWRNTPSVKPDVRIVAIRAGFEVLLDAGSGAVDSADALSELLDRPETPRFEGSWKSLTGRSETTRAFTNLGWWFLSFAFLRNAVTHAEPIPLPRYRFGGTHHIMLAERALRRAIKEVVARQGFERVRLGPFERAIERGFAAARQQTRRERREGDGEPAPPGAARRASPLRRGRRSS